MKTIAKLLFAFTLISASFIFFSCDLPQEVIEQSLTEEEKLALLDSSLERIEITTEPSKKVYYMGDDFNSDGLVVTGYFTDNVSFDVTSYVQCIGFDSTEETENQVVTVSLNDKTDSFSVVIKYRYVFSTKPKEVTESGSAKRYVYFGDFPQTVVPQEDVGPLGLETSTNIVKQGMYDYVLGNDGNYYVKCLENSSASTRADYHYFNGDCIHKLTDNNYRWFKVEPIKWRVECANYVYDGPNGVKTAKLLLAEKALMSNVPYSPNPNMREIDGVSIYPNNYRYSQIRAYLNGYTYYSNENKELVTKEDYVNGSEGCGFLQTAFSKAAQDNIIDTIVRNDISTTNNLRPYQYPPKYFICADTRDKVFLISTYEYNLYVRGVETGKRWCYDALKFPTDFALANFGCRADETVQGAYYFTRSPEYSNGAVNSDKDNVQIIGPTGYDSEIQAGTDGGFRISSSAKYVSVVPAIVVDF